jgi:hypothetical protein
MRAFQRWRQCLFSVFCGNKAVLKEGNFLPINGMNTPTAITTNIYKIVPK